jgi:hypothetical protein
MGTAQRKGLHPIRVNPSESDLCGAHPSSALCFGAMEGIRLRSEATSGQADALYQKLSEFDLFLFFILKS